MNNQQYIVRIKAVINHLNAATLRADQLDAATRIAVCTAELNDIANALAVLPAEKDEEVEKDVSDSI